MKKSVSILLVMAAVMMLSVPVFAAGWGYDSYTGTNYWYYDNGTIAVNSWIHDGIEWSAVDMQGDMLVNEWVLDSTGWSYVDANGYQYRNETSYVPYCAMYYDMTTGMHIISGQPDGYYSFDSNGYNR